MPSCSCSMLAVATGSFSCLLYCSCFCFSLHLLPPSVKKVFFFFACIVILTHPFGSFRFLRSVHPSEFCLASFLSSFVSWVVWFYFLVALFLFEKVPLECRFFFTTTKTNVVLVFSCSPLGHSILRCFCRRLRCLRRWI